ncbi:hypothetical protein CRE_31376 [Caenorhabditis remanei]|uniref:Zinc finger PHD-type domain-containing protein n=1 Tax=Caenorhabditis remanei TaxID=31234 RepID=E3MY98_CAERE|nr:hypothetical protein CRE_31376 [Caenorhabditis remanei]
MPPIKKKVKSCRENGQNSIQRQLEKSKVENSRIRAGKKADLTTIENIIIAMTMIRNDISVSMKEVIFWKDSTVKLEQEKDIIKSEISEKSLQLQHLENQKTFMLKEAKRREKVIKKKEESLNTFQDSLDKMKLLSPTAGKRLALYENVSDRKTKLQRCRLAINAIKEIVGSLNIDSFLKVFFKYVNDSTDFNVKYQLSDMETFYCKVRFNLPDGFFRLFKKYYKEITGFDVFSSRHDIADIQRNISVSSYYRISTQSIQTKTLSGVLTTVKKPIVQITSLSEVLSQRLSTLAAHNRLRFDEGTGENISVAIAGDKGGDETKLVLILENLEKPNDSRGQLLLGWYNGSDDYQSLKDNMSDVFAQFNSLTEIKYNDGSTDVTRKVVKKVSGDIKFCSALYQHSGQSSSEPCHYCKISISNHGRNVSKLENTAFEDIGTRRTLAEYKQKGNPLVDVDLCNVAIPPMHCVQGLLQKYAINYFVALANVIDSGDPDFPETLEQQRRRVKDLEFEEMTYVQRIKSSSEDKDQLGLILEALSKLKRTRRKSKKSCSSTFCIANSIKRDCVDLDTYQCNGCQEIFHFCCNGIVSMEEKATSRLANNRISCFECDLNHVMSTDERISVVKKKKEDLEDAMMSDEETWSTVNTEKENTLKIIHEQGGANSVRQKFDDLMKSIKCDNYNCSKNLTGNMSRRFLRKEVIDEVVSIFPWSQQLEDVRNFLYHLEFLMSSSDNNLKTPAEIDEIEEHLIGMIECLRSAHPKKNVNVKLHLVAAHLMEYLRQHLSWGRISEQGVEHIHSTFNNLHLKLAPIRDPVAKANAILNYFSNENFLFDCGDIWNT